VGGLVGDLNSGSIIDTYARGSVNGTDSTSSTGGLVGWVEASNTVSNSYSSGAVISAGSVTGGLVGTNDGTLATSYWDNQASGFSTVGVGSGSSSGTAGLTTSQLQLGVMPTGFNGTNTVWVAPAQVYPYFGWQGPLVTINGNAFNGSGALGSAGVGVLWKGSPVARATTQSDGFYFVAVPANMTVGGVLTYLTSLGVANTFSDGMSPFVFLHMDLQVGSLSILNAANSTLSGLTNSLAATVGNRSGSNFLYTVSNGLLNLNSGAAFQLASYSNFTFDQPLTTPANIIVEGAQNISIANSNAITAGAGRNILIALASPSGIFNNQAGANALQVSGDGCWDVYSNNPVNDTTGGLVPSYIQYRASPLSTRAHLGNGLLYTLAPVITPSLTGSVSKTYDGITAALLSAGNVSGTGMVNGDVLTFATPTSAAYSTANAGSAIGVTASGISIASATNGNIPVYGYQLAATSATGNIGAITPAMLTYTANPGSRPYGVGNPVFSGTVTGFVDGQTLASATTGTALFTSPAGVTSAAGTYAIKGSGLTADYGDYIFTQAAGNASALTIKEAVGPTPTPTPTPTPKPTPTPTPKPTVLTVVIGNATNLQNSKPTFTAAYTGAAIQGLDIASILSGLTFTVTPSLAGPGIYTITATGTAPQGYVLNIAPATLTLVGTTPELLPTQAPVIPVVVPQLLPDPGGNEAASLVQPLNSVGLFQVNVTGTGSGFGASFIGFGGPQTPLSQSAFFGTDNKKETYSAGAKP